MSNESTSKIKLIVSAIIFGTVGVFRRIIPLSSGLISFLRAIIGGTFLLLFVIFSKKKIDFRAIKKNFVILVVSGVLIAINWIFLFEAFNYTSVSTATLCSYMSPIFVIIASPFILKEKLVLKKIICIAFSFIGIFFVSGVINTGFSIADIKGALLALCGALFYASAVLCNKKMTEIGSNEKTIVQLFSAALILFPYVIYLVITGNIFLPNSTETRIPLIILMILILGIVHTGITYVLYFSSLSGLNAQSIAILSFIDPIVAVILSATILKEPIGKYEIIGGILILGSVLISELNFKKENQK